MGDLAAGEEVGGIHSGNTVAGVATGLAAAAGAAGRRLLQWRRDSSVKDLDPEQVFAALKATIGEDWVCDREAHICLLGSAGQSKLVKSLYKLMTARLTLRHVSVASGGFEAAVSCATRQQLEIIRV